MKILLYGIGGELENIESRIKNEHEIIGYTDSYAKIKEYLGKAFFEVDEIRNQTFDYLIITVSNCKIAWDIQNRLVRDYGIPLEKIIPFWVYAKRELWKYKMETYDLENIRGMIFGNSYAFYGFLEEGIEKPFINLSVTSQDLFYSYQIYNRCMAEYGTRLQNLEYIILDLYDYIFFNIDLSLGHYFFEYFYLGGLYEPHNFAENKNFSRNLKDELFDIYGIILGEGEKRRILDKIFSNSNIQPIIRPNDVWNYIDKDAPLSPNWMIGSGIRKRFEKTIEENMDIMIHFLESIRKKNKDMKIIFTLIPKYITMEKAAEPFMKEWKEEFHHVIAHLCSKYQAFFWSYKQCREISENPRFYLDTRHLNTVGARAMTTILNKGLQEI